MKNRIFITGFQRGGTTLLRRLLHNHPDIECMIHERRILNRVKNFEEKTIIKVVKKYPKWEGNVEGIWGEKVPWNSPTGQEIINYMNKWQKAFGDNACYINIIRNPIDAGKSNAKLDLLSLSATKNNWDLSMPVVTRFINRIGGINIVYENLVITPKPVLKKIFDYCNLDCSRETIDYISSLDREALRYFNKIDSSRAFVHIKGKEKERYMKFVKEYWI